MRYLSWLLIVPLWLCLIACADVGYYWQSVQGHVALMHAARSVDDWLLDPKTSTVLKDKLVLAQKIRTFAVEELKLPDNASYKRYADIKRKAVVWNVVAAPALSLKLKTWCFPVAGCVGYRGYFAEADAQHEAAQLKKQDLDVSVYGVPAYSTLGWSNWAGGDPLLNTFIAYPEGELARIIFHELAHQVVYVADDTAFNESFATAVERLGVERWLAKHGSNAAKTEYGIHNERRKQFRALTYDYRVHLSNVYHQYDSVGHGRDANDFKFEMEAMKDIAINEFKEKYEQLKTSWKGYMGYDNWVKQANNASFGALAAYDDAVPQFEALFAQQGGDWPKFYAAVEGLAALPKEKRQMELMKIEKSTH